MRNDRAVYGGQLMLWATFTLCLACGARLVLAQVGGGYDVTWNTIDGGGVMSSAGGGFELAGTIGQPDAGLQACAGGEYTISGGFWFTKIACNVPSQDGDGDADVDLADFLEFQKCFNGPNRAWKPSPADPMKCLGFDIDDDTDVDLADFLEFQKCFNGPNRPPKC